MGGICMCFMSVMRVTPVAKGIRVLDGELLKLWYSPSFLKGPKPCHHFVTFSLLQNKECIKNMIAKTVLWLLRCHLCNPVKENFIFRNIADQFGRK